jgi:hypothetical protein
MAKLSTPSHPCSLVYVGGYVCQQRAFRKGLGGEWRCRKHTTTISAVGFMATKAGWQFISIPEAI